MVVYVINSLSNNGSICYQLFIKYAFVAISCGSLFSVLPKFISPGVPILLLH